MSRCDMGDNEMPLTSISDMYTRISSWYVSSKYSDSSFLRGTGVEGMMLEVDVAN